MVSPVGGRSYEFTVFDCKPAARANMRQVGQDWPAPVEHGLQRNEVTLVEVAGVVRLCSSY